MFYKRENVALIEQLRWTTLPERRLAIAKKLNVDLRPIEAGLLDTVFVIHLTSVAKLVNLAEEPLSVLNFAAGMDILTNLLAFNPGRVFMVAPYEDLTVEMLVQAQKDIESFRVKRDSEYEAYKKEKYNISLTSSSLVESTDGKIVSLDSDLQALGLDFADSRQVQVRNGRCGPTLCFDWKYHLSNVARRRTITFINNPELTKYEGYGKALTCVLQNGVDIYLQKAAERLAADYSLPFSFIHFIQPSIRKYFVTDDSSFSSETKWVDRFHEFPLSLHRLEPVHRKLIWESVLSFVTEDPNYYRSEDGVARCRYGKYFYIRSARN
jgi:hypothetical protein